jgi:hypothetical protein
MGHESQSIDFMDIKTFVDRTSVSRSECYRAMRTGKLKFRVIANRRRISVEAAKTYLNSGG